MEKFAPSMPASDTRYVATADGLRLAVETCDAADAPTLLFAHGFGQTRGAWGGTVAALAAQGCRCVSYDARGHGESGRLPDGADSKVGYHMQQVADDLLALACAQPEPPVLVGASMGGLLGLVAAGETRPPPFRALVLVDITPRWETKGVERILAFMQAHPDGFADYAEAAEQIARAKNNSSHCCAKAPMAACAGTGIRPCWPAAWSSRASVTSRACSPRQPKWTCRCCCSRVRAATWSRTPRSPNSCSWCRTRAMSRWPAPPTCWQAT